MPNRCKALSRSGQPCRAYAGAGEYCFTHDPGKAADRAAARKLGGYRRKTTHGGDPDKLPAEIRSLADVLGLLDYIRAELVASENGIPRARALIALVAEYRAAIVAGELEERVKSLEEQVYVTKSKPADWRS